DHAVVAHRIRSRWLPGVGIALEGAAAADAQLPFDQRTIQVEARAITAVAVAAQREFRALAVQVCRRLHLVDGAGGTAEPEDVRVRAAADLNAIDCQRIDR